MKKKITKKKPARKKPLPFFIKLPWEEPGFQCGQSKCEEEAMYISKDGKFFCAGCKKGYQKPKVCKYCGV